MMLKLIGFRRACAHEQMDEQMSGKLLRRVVIIICTKLVGGKGTTYDSNHMDKTYAHIDNGPYDPGYLSDINSDVFYEGGIFYQIRPGGTTVYVTQGMDNIYEEYIPYTEESYNIPETVMHGGKTYTVTGVYDWAFWDCDALTGVNMGDHITSIGDNAFNNCTGLTSITIPDGVTSIYLSAFQGCTSLETITCHAVTPPTIYSNTFSSYTATLYVPAGSVNAYKVAYYWKNFLDIRPISAVTRGDVDGNDNVNISDVTALINYLLSGDASTINVDAADCDQNSNVNIGDVTVLINYLLSGHW